MTPIATLPRVARGSWLLVTQDASRACSVGPLAVVAAPAGATHSWVFPPSLGRPPEFAGLGRHHQRQRGGWCSYRPVWGRALEERFRGEQTARAEGVYLLSDAEIAEIALHEPDERGYAVHRMYLGHLAGVTP